jgi:hypothetical protein
VNEAYADGKVNASVYGALATAVLNAWNEVAERSFSSVVGRASIAAALAPLTLCWRLVDQRAWVPGTLRDARTLGMPEREQADLIRCVCGNPFRQPPFDASWRTTTVTSIAPLAYDDRDWSLMPVPADALEDAGCECQAVLDHCRRPGPHARGCWVVDLALGKE